MKYTWSIILLLVAFCFACDKDVEPENGASQPLVFHSLSAGADTISAGATTDITANAEGYLITYYWSASAGSLLGGGANVTFVSSPCLNGKYSITCMVKDANNQTKSKTIYVVVE